MLCESTFFLVKMEVCRWLNRILLKLVQLQRFQRSNRWGNVGLTATTRVVGSWSHLSDLKFSRSRQIYSRRHVFQDILVISLSSLFHQQLHQMLKCFSLRCWSLCPQLHPFYLHQNLHSHGKFRESPHKLHWQFRFEIFRGNWIDIQLAHT